KSDKRINISWFILRNGYTLWYFSSFTEGVELMGKRVVLALGGNAILQPKQEATYDNQYNNVITATEKMIEIRKAGHEIVVTHGNGPQVGNIIAQNEYAKDNVPALPIDVCSAESQGMIGYMMEMALKNHLNKDKSNANVSTLLTMVEVDKDDKA